MKKTIAALFACVATATFAGQNDLNITFSTPGPDKYADGTTVLDGEFYALVWTKDGVQTNVIAKSLAEDGKCPKYRFIVDDADFEKYSGGTWGVYLLDTRDFTTDPSGKTLSKVVDGKPEVVNVMASIKDGIANASAFESAKPNTAIAPGSYDLAAANVPLPKVTGIQVKDGKVSITVADTRPFVGYTLESGADVGDFDLADGASSKSGDATKEIVLEANQQSAVQFFKVSSLK